VVNLIPRQRAPQLVLADAGLANATGGRFAAVDVLATPARRRRKVHVIGDASATTQPKAGHIANQEAKVCADALARIFRRRQPRPGAGDQLGLLLTITMSKASWLHALFQYDSASASMKARAGGDRCLGRVGRRPLRGHGRVVQGLDGGQLRLS
jgi:sulfide dehydrogenase [flavocytochrome c] flavoprotein chain